MFLIALSFALGQNQANWKFVGNTSEAAYSVNMSSISRTSSGSRKAWIRHVFHRPDDKGTKTVLELWDYRCEDHEATITSLVTYNATGKILISGRPGAREYSDTIPGSMGELLENEVCSA
jgi:hypothetical protein